MNAQRTVRSSRVAKHRSRGVAALVTAAALVAALGSGHAGAQRPDTTGAAGSGEGASSGRLVVGMDSDLSTLDLGKYSAANDNRILLNVYDSLTSRDADGRLIPWLAKSWELSDDLLTWTFYLEEDVTFHNGEHMTAEDVAFSINRYADDEYPGGVSGEYAQVDNAVAVDDYTVEVTMTEPNVRWDEAISLKESPIIPKSLAETMSYEEYASSPETAVGTGPYRIVSWDQDQRLVLEAYDDYWGGPAAIKDVEFIPIPDTNARIAALMAGDIDIAMTLPVEATEALEGSRAEVRDSWQPMRVRLTLNAVEGPFSDIRLRQALNHAIDRQSIVDNLLAGLAIPIVGHALPNEVGFHPDLEEAYPYDPERARELVIEAGYEDGVEMELIARNHIMKIEEVAEAIAGMAAEVGITLNVRVVSTSDYNVLSENKDFDVALGGQPGGGAFNVDRSYVTIFHMTRGNPVHTGFYVNPEVDELLDQTLTLPNEEATPIWQNIDEILQEDAAGVMLYWEPTLWGVASDLTYVPHGTGAVFVYDAAW